MINSNKKILKREILGTTSIHNYFPINEILYRYFLYDTKTQELEYITDTTNKPTRLNGGGDIIHKINHVILEEDNGILRKKYEKLRGGKLHIEDFVMVGDPIKLIEN